MSKKIIAIIFVLAFAVSGAGFAAGGGVTDSVIVAMSPESEPEEGFDPAYGWGAGEHVHEPLIQSTLTVTNADMSIGYDLATDMSSSGDGLVWTVEIREDAYFTDGEPLTAEDVAFTYNTVRDTTSVADFTMLEEAVATGGYEVEFHMNRPYSMWPYTMAVTGIVPAHAYGDGYGRNPIGSGRYILKQWDVGQQVILEANPDYYGEAPLMEKVTIVFMGEDTAFAAAKAGAVDVAYTPAAYSGQQVDGYSLLDVKTVDNRGINLPAALPDGTMGNGVTAGAAMRQAINMGIDRDEMIQNVLNGYGSPAYSVCDGMPWFSEDMAVKFDRDAANALLDGAGWVMGDDGVRVKDGVRAELTLLYPVGDTVRQMLAADAANQMKELGIAANIEGVGWDTAYARALQNPMVWGWGAHTPMELYNIYHTAEGGTARYSPYASESVDAYMDGAMESADLEESYELWKKAQWDGEGGIAADVPWVWLVNIDHLYFVRDGLNIAEQKLHPHGHGWSIVNNVDRWSWSA